MDDFLELAGKKFKSRLLTGSGKYHDERIIKEILETADCDIITVALRRVDFNNPQNNIVNFIPQGKQLMPNTSGARTAEEAVRIAKLSKEMGYGNWIKIEVIKDSKYLLPDNLETLKATEILVNDGFAVFAYMQPDLAMGRRMAQAGATAVMPLAAPIGSNKGLLMKETIRIMIEEIDTPIIVDAGIGKPSHACEAMEMGAAAILLNTAIAASKNPVLMAKAFKNAVEAGRLGFLAGFAKESSVSASSPLTGFLD
ncbi:MAG: thiazole synthase [Chitinispirillales bacterium]|jgi:thiazole synthase|nr:thiazole synthase [Chitinispirillales bacterium]